MGSNSNHIQRRPQNFHVWFSDIELYLFNKNNAKSQDEDDVELENKKRIEKFKRLILQFKDSDAMLEWIEDSRNGKRFMITYNPLEVFAVLGGLALLRSFVGTEKNDDDDDDEEAKNETEEFEEFLQSYQKHEARNEKYASVMNQIVKGFGKDEVDSEGVTITSIIQLHFLRQFGEIVPDKVFEEILANLEDDNATTNLQLYFIRRYLRRQRDEVQEGPVNLTEEKKCIERAASSIEPTNPIFLLAKSHFLADYFLIHNKSEELTFCGEQFETHSEIVAWIRQTSESVVNSHPSFIRANFEFADMFANTLPITRQDREYSKQLLNKALQTNPTSSKINHKMGLFLIKSRQFSESANYFTKAIQCDPTNPEFYQSLAKLLLRDVNSSASESFFMSTVPDVTGALGSENELSFWKGCFHFKRGETSDAVTIWVETILEFYVTKPELELETVLPFKELSKVTSQFLWTKGNGLLSLAQIQDVVREAGVQEKTKRRVVFQRLSDLVRDAIKDVDSIY